MGPWIGVDFDGTLAEYNKWQGPDHAGKPIPKMAERVKQWLAEGKDVRIFTARVFVPEPPVETDLKKWKEVWKRREEAAVSRATINHFCMENFGRELPITCTKDFAMTELWDDRCVQVIPNTGLAILDRYYDLLDQLNGA